MNEKPVKNFEWWFGIAAFALIFGIGAWFKTIS